MNRLSANFTAASFLAGLMSFLIDDFLLSNPPVMKVGSIRLRLYSVMSFDTLVFQVETFAE